MAKPHDDGGAAFPAIWSHGFTEEKYPTGMSLRDYFAAQALPAIYAWVDAGTRSETIAGDAYDLADAMLKRRAK